MQKQFKRGQIWMAEFYDGVGSEQKGRQRPILIAQNDMGNFYAPTVTIVPLTSRTKRWMPTHVTLHKTICLLYTSTALVEQITTISKERFIKFLGMIDSSEMIQVEEAIRVQMGIAG